jgi:hypothetical protein
VISGGQQDDVGNRLAEGIARLVSSSAGGPLPPATDRASFDILERRVTLHRRRRRVARVSVLAAGALAVAVGGYWGSGQFFASRSGALTYRVGGGPSLQTAGVLDSGVVGAGASVTFSDGTSLRMEARARGRVLELDRRGGRVVLDEGRARVEVRRRPNARWFFQAGPFEVRVHGTAFSLGWDPASAHFDLHMEDGVVSVAGPLSGGEIMLRAGESLSIGLHDDGAAAPGSLPEAPSLARAPTSPLPAAAAAVGTSLPETRARRRDEAPSITERTVTPARWREELRDGHAGAVVADARRRGLARVLESASSEDLAALADASRFIGSDNLARRVLLAQRRRFPRSSRAAEASFLLGRLDDESLRGGARALDWYDHYLAEAPAGAYVSEALGRKMMGLERARRRDEAVAIASSYLERFPEGSYAHAASALVERAAARGDAPSSRAR